MTHREVETAWAAGLAGAGVPVVLTGAARPRPRPRLVFGAPVPVGVTAEREPLDLYLAQRLTVADLRARLQLALPPGHEIVELYDVWLGSPSVAALVIAGDYRCDLAEPAAALAPAVGTLLAARSVVRPGRKGGEAKPYDLRPLVDRLAVTETRPSLLERPEAEPARGPAHDGADAGDGMAADRSVLAMRLLIGSESGSGRPEEVVEALAAILGRPIGVGRVVRERLVLAGEG